VEKNGEKQSIATFLILFWVLPGFVLGGLLSGIVMSWACFTLILSHKFLRLWGNYDGSPKHGINSIKFYKNGELNIKGKIVFTIIMIIVLFSIMGAFIQIDNLNR
jgi:hypothetical protein